MGEWGSTSESMGGPAVGASEQVEGEGAQEPSLPGRGHIGALDGIRAVAVLAVMAFHFGISWMGGGLLGVDIFFVLSGFLITSLLVAEFNRRSTISFRHFYERRARRLLPALGLCMLLVAAYAFWMAEPATVSTIRGDALSTLLYVANWRFVLSDQSYFVHYGPPSPVLQTWSLSVEEQFYLIWPAVCLLVLRRWGARGLAIAAAAGVVASFWDGFALLHVGVSTSRLYYGTDVRAQELLAGAFLAAWWNLRDPAPHRLAVPTTRGVRLARIRTMADRGRPYGLQLAGLLGAGFLIWALLNVQGEGPFLYEGGFLLVAASTVAVIALVVRRPAHPLSRLLALRPVRYVGRISYGLYLYHWPILLMMTGPRVGIYGTPLVLLHFAATFAVAVASFHLVEEPIRRRHVLASAHRLLVALPAGACAVVVLLVLSTLPMPAGGSAVPPVLTARARAGLAVPAHPPAGLVGAHRVRALLVGDSMALTLGEGLEVHASRWGVDFINRGVLGCDLDWNSTVEIEDNVTRAAPGCIDWPTTWKRYVDTLDPDVVAVALGRWEVSARIVDGRWTDIGQPLWDNLLLRLLDQAVRILSSRGAHVALFTLPYVKQTTVSPSGAPWGVNQPVRTNDYNALLHNVAARFPRIVTIVNENRMLDPQGHYTTFIDGIQVRNQDEEHPSKLGGMFLRPLILPKLAVLGLPHERARTAPASR